MANPFGDFIQQYMQIQGFNLEKQKLQEQQRQFDDQAYMQQRQIENAEVQNYAQLLGQVQNPQEATALANFFSERNPDMSAVFQSLNQSVAPTLDTHMRGAAQRAGAPAADAALAISQGRALNAGQVQQGGQFQQQFGEGVRQFDTSFGRGVFESDRSFAENLRQFNASMSQRASEFGQTMGFNRAQLAQQGALGQMSNMTQGGMLPMMLKGQLSQQVAQLRSQASMARPEARAGIERQIADMERQMSVYDSVIQADINRGQGQQGMDLNQLIQATGAAWDDINTARDPGEQQSALERYNMLQRLMGSYGGSAMQFNNGWFGGTGTQIAPRPLVGGR